MQPADRSFLGALALVTVAKFSKHTLLAERGANLVKPPAMLRIDAILGAQCVRNPPA
jgi:hypothetical protein